MERFVFEGDKMGTIFRVVVVSGDFELAKNLVEKAFLEVDRIEKTYSRFIHDNELFDLNNHLGEWTRVSEEFYELIKFGERLKLETAGAFDLTVKSVLEGWGYDENYSFAEGGVGKLGEIEFGENCTLKISAPIDLGALGKGYAVDRAAEILGGIGNFCVNAGGDIYVKGCDLEESGWKVLFEDSTDVTQAIGFTVVSDLAMASSNALRRKWSDKSHLIDARKLESAKDMMAVYTQAQNCLTADAYSTALFVMGFEEAKSVLKSFPVEAMLVSKKGEIFRTPNFKGDLFTE